MLAAPVLLATVKLAVELRGAASSAVELAVELRGAVSDDALDLTVLALVLAGAVMLAGAVLLAAVELIGATKNDLRAVAAATGAGVAAVATGVTCQVVSAEACRPARVNMQTTVGCIRVKENKLEPPSLQPSLLQHSPQQQE